MSNYLKFLADNAVNSIPKVDLLADDGTPFVLSIRGINKGKLIDQIQEILESELDRVNKRDDTKITPDDLKGFPKIVSAISSFTSNVKLDSKQIPLTQRNEITGNGKVGFKQSLKKAANDTITDGYKISGRTFKEHIISLFNEIAGKIRELESKRVGADIDIKKKKRSLAKVKNIKDLRDEFDIIDANQNKILDDIKELDANKPGGYILSIKNARDEFTTLENVKTNILEQIKQIDKEIYRELQEEEKKKQKEDAERDKLKRKSNLENKRKYKIMSRQSNQLAQEIQKTIERVAAQGYEYSGHGYKKPKKVMKKKVMKPKKIKKGGRYYEDPADEVAYILERLGEMIHSGDIQHIGLVAKKLRKVKKIGRGKYFVRDEEVYEHEGSGYPIGGKRKKMTKEGKPKRAMSPKQKAWIKFVKQVHKANPELSYKEAMKLASEQRLTQ